MQQVLHRHGLVDSLRHFLAEIDQSFCKFTRIQFNAPWRGRSGNC